MGGIKIENRENLGQYPNKGGRGAKKQKCPNFNLGILKTEGGGQHFSKMSEIQKCPKGRRGGEGSTLIGILSQIFSIFYFDASPNLFSHFSRF